LREIRSHLGKNTDRVTHRGLLVFKRDHHVREGAASLILRDDAEHYVLRAPAVSFGKYLFSRQANGVNSPWKRRMFFFASVAALL
jgi:hypothetical protein